MKGIPGFKGKYTISPKAEVTYSDTGVVVVPKLKEGYLTVGLYNSRVAGAKPVLIRMRLHVVMMQVYGTPQSEGKEITFLDGNRRNCTIGNLAWLHEVPEKDRIPLQKQEPLNNGYYKHKKEQALKLYLEGHSTSEISGKLSVSRTFVQRHVTGSEEAVAYRKANPVRRRSYTKAVRQIDITTGDTVQEYSSSKMAGFTTGIGSNNIRGCCSQNGRRKSAGGYKWEYIE